MPHAPCPSAKHAVHGTQDSALGPHPSALQTPVKLRPLMRWSNYFLYTLREVPADADVISQKLMMRSGMIRKVAAGIYTYLPLGVRSLHKLEVIVREEMG